MTKIEELEQKLDNAVENFRIEMNECKAELEKLKESKKEVGGKWKPSLDKLYWYRGDEGINLFDTWEKDEIDEWRRKNLKIFETEEECEKYWKFRDVVKEKSYEFSKLEWEDRSVPKYYIYYIPISKKFVITYELSQKNLGGIYFKMMADAQYIIDNYEEELLKYFL